MIGTLVPTLLPILTDVVRRFLPEDAQQRAEAEREIESALTNHLSKIDLAQLEVNRAEAGNRRLFVSGWRPFVGWTCGAALAYTYVVQPMIMFGLAQSGNLVQIPTLEIGELMPLLMGLLGLGGLRTYEKVRRVA
jgi:hypothetical protein